MAKKAESRLVSQVIAELKRRLPKGSIVRKLSDGFTRGLPDVQAIAVLPMPENEDEGDLVLIEIECKVGDGKVSKIQRVDFEKRCELAEQITGSGRYLPSFCTALQGLSLFLDDLLP